MINKSYVAGLLFSPTLESVVLIKKNRPEWMAGLWNGIGGVEEGYDPSSKYAMSREFEEETGLHIPPNEWLQYATLETIGASVHWFTAKNYKWASVETKTDEQVSTFRRNRVLESEHLLMPNLLWLYEMARAFHTGKDRCNQHFVREIGYVLNV